MLKSPVLHRVHGLECLEDRQGSAGATEGTPSGRDEQNESAEDDAQPETVLPEARVPTAPEASMGQPGAAAAAQSAAHDKQRMAAPLHAAEKHMPDCKAEEPPSHIPAWGTSHPHAMPFLPVRHRPHVAAAVPSAAGSSFRGSAFARVELLGGSREGSRGSQGPPQEPAKDQPSSPRKFAPHARSPVPEARVSIPSQGEGPFGDPPRPGMMPQNRGVPLGLGTGLPESAQRRGGLGGGMLGGRGRHGRGFRGSLRGGGRARCGRSGDAVTKGGIASFEHDAGALVEYK